MDEVHSESSNAVDGVVKHDRHPQLSEPGTDGVQLLHLKRDMVKGAAAAQQPAMKGRALLARAVWDYEFDLTQQVTVTLELRNVPEEDAAILVLVRATEPPQTFE
jgi:hypothetical protein